MHTVKSDLVKKQQKKTNKKGISCKGGARIRVSNGENLFKTVKGSAEHDRVAATRPQSPA